MAVLLALYSHLRDEASNAGLVGVRLFFVLSGFLVTGTLIEARDTGGSSLGHFYFRRALRLSW